MGVTAPFRDPFVELPRAVFESLQAIGEGAVARAQRAAHAAVAPVLRPDRRASLFSERWIRRVHERYGWHWAELRRYEDRKEMRVLAGLDCGHMQSYVVDERAVSVARGLVDEIELLDRVVDRTERSCQCVRRAEPPA